MNANFLLNRLKIDAIDTMVSLKTLRLALLRNQLCRLEWFQFKKRKTVKKEIEEILNEVKSLFEERNAIIKINDK